MTDVDQRPRAWSLLTILDDERTFQGNEGYEDEIGRCYLYDSRVPNSRHLSRGDVIVVRDQEWVLGVGLIERVDQAPGVKTIRRCRKCGVTNLKARKSLLPIYRCGSCKAKFDDPVEELIEVTSYEAHYEGHWAPVEFGLRVREFDHAYLNNAQQHAIREVSLYRALAIPMLAQLIIELLPDAKQTVSQRGKGRESGNVAREELVPSNRTVHAPVNEIALSSPTSESKLRRAWALSLLRYAPTLKLKRIAKITGVQIDELRTLKKSLSE